jgi:hypothetical protein
MVKNKLKLPFATSIRSPYSRDGVELIMTHAARRGKSGRGSCQIGRYPDEHPHRSSGVVECSRLMNIRIVQAGWWNVRV